MSVANRRGLREVLNSPRLIYGMLKGSSDTVQPLDVSERGNLCVEQYDENGNIVNPASLTPNMDGQSPTQFNVTPADQEALAANANRSAAVLVNDSDTNMYLGLGAATAANNGIRLNAGGGTIVLSRWGSLFTTEAIHAIHGGVGNKVLAIQEMI